MRQLYNFKIGTEDDPVEELFEMEDLHVTQNNAGMSVDSDPLYTCFVFAVPAAKCSLEIRNLNLNQVYDRKEVINLVRSKYEIVCPSFDKSKGSSKSLAIVGKGGSGSVGRVERRMGKAKEATATPIQTVEPGK